jgi:hypothetical protein
MKRICKSHALVNKKSTVCRFQIPELRNSVNTELCRSFVNSNMTKWQSDTKYFRMVAPPQRIAKQLSRTFFNGCVMRYLYEVFEINTRLSRPIPSYVSLPKLLNGFL